MAPNRRTTQAPRGHTPILPQQGKHRQKVSVAGAVYRSPVAGHARMFYETYPDFYVDAYLYAQFIRRLLGEIRGPMVLLHDRGKIHEGEWFEELREDFPWLQVEPFPPYAPELNPVEPLWNYSKDKQLANFVPATVWQLDTRLHAEFQIITADQSRLQSFFAATHLPW